MQSLVFRLISSFSFHCCKIKEAFWEAALHSFLKFRMKKMHIRNLKWAGSFYKINIWSLFIRETCFVLVYAVMVPKRQFCGFYADFRDRYWSMLKNKFLPSQSSKFLAKYFLDPIKYNLQKNKSQTWMIEYFSRSPL